MLYMELLRNLCLLFLVLAALLCGCSQSNEEGVKSAKRFEELKALPLDTVLSRAFAFYEQYQATNDTLLRDSMNDYKSHFFARWKRSTDSICTTVPADDSLAADLRDIYEVVLEFKAKRMYRYILDREKRDSLENTLNEKRKNAKPIDIADILADMKKWKENPDSIRTLHNQRDSVESAEIWGIPLEEALAGLKNDSNNVLNRVYFVQTMDLVYMDTSASDMNDLDKINLYRIKRKDWKKVKSACLNKTPMGQQVIVLNDEYESLLNNFMKANVHESRQERYTLLPNKYPFWYPMISVVPHHSGDDYHFNSFPTIWSAVFNKTHDMVMLNVEESFNNGGSYYLSKKNGKWKLVMHKRGWVA